MDSNGNWIINPKPLYAYLAVDAILAISCFSGLLPYSTGWLIGAVAFHICLLWYLLISIKEKTTRRFRNYHWSRSARDTDSNAYMNLRS